MFRKGQFLYYNNRMCQVWQTQDDELIYICVSKKAYTRPDTIWINMDEARPICPVCNEPSKFDIDGDILLCDDCSACKSEAADHAEHLNRCEW